MAKARSLRPLGRRKPPDFTHVEKHPLMMRGNTPMDVTKPSPVVWGVNWYSSFDNPVRDKDGSWWVGKDPNNLGHIRGGHAVCSPPNGFDNDYRYKFYDQGSEGACVGFASSRAMSLLNGLLYNAWWLWDEAKKIDIWPDTNPGDSNGTSVRAAFDVLRMQGHVRNRKNSVPDLKHGVIANKWATNIDNVHSVLQNEKYKKKGAIPILNSWYKGYPRLVWSPDETWNRLLNEDGEATMLTDRAA